jgi:hypothetical protein
MAKQDYIPKADGLLGPQSVARPALVPYGAIWFSV